MEAFSIGRKLHRHNYPLNPTNEYMYEVTDMLDDVDIEIRTINMSDVKCIGINVRCDFNPICDKLIKLNK